MTTHPTDGAREDLGRAWLRTAQPPTPTITARDYEDQPKVLYGPSGSVIARVVDPGPQMGFKPGGHD